MSRKRRKPLVGGTEANEGQELLFEVAKPDPPVAEATPKVVRCSECNALLRSDRSKAAGVSERCAALVGIVVIASMRKAKNLKAQGAAAA